jgi:putative methyltransferase (TIGR04325 family)
MMRSLVRDWIPPVLANIIRRLINPKSDDNQHDIVWDGDYTSWEEALAASTGYDSDNILQKVKESTLKVKRGEAVFERDSVIFDEIQYSWSVLSGLMWTAARHQGRLDVLDFGGSLGSTYFQNRKFLAGLSEVHWSVVEQPSFVDCGQKYIEDDCLKFYKTIEECLTERKPNVVLLSGVLPYLADWVSLLQIILANNIDTVLVDRTPFTLDGKERVTVQKVPEWICPATYPCWFLDETKFLHIFAQARYEMIEEFSALDQANIPSIHKGFIFTYKNKL